MSNGQGFTPKVQAAWQEAGNQNLAKTGLTWDQVLGYIAQQQGGSDRELQVVDIPGLGKFSINYGSLGPGPDAGHGVIGIAREGGGTDMGAGPDGGHYTDTMVGYAPGTDGKIQPYSYAINKSNGPLAAFLATIATLGAGAQFGVFGGASGGAGSVGGAGGAAGAAGGYAIPTGAELTAAGFGSGGGMGMTGAGGIGAAGSVSGAGAGAAGYGAAGAGAAAGAAGGAAGGAGEGLTSLQQGTLGGAGGGGVTPLANLTPGTAATGATGAKAGASAAKGAAGAGAGGGGGEALTGLTAGNSLTGILTNPNLLGLGGSLVSNLLSGNAAGNAANQQNEAIDRGIEEQRRQYNQNRTDLAPYRTRGYQAANKLAMMMGLQPDPNTFGQDQAAVDNDPIFGSGFQSAPTYQPKPSTYQQRNSLANYLKKAQ